MPTRPKRTTIQDLPGYLRARDQTMGNLAARAAELSPAYTPRSQIDPADLLTQPLLAYCALAMPLRDWHAADGVMRPERWYDLPGHIRFARAVYRAKRTIDDALTRMAHHGERQYHRR